VNLKSKTYESDFIYYGGARVIGVGMK